MGKYLVSLFGLVATLGVALPASADWELKNLATGRCLGVRSASKTSGAQVVTYDCDNTLNQRWIQGAYWSGNQFSHLKTRVLEQTTPGSPPQAGNRCLGLSGNNAVSVDCNYNSTDPNSDGWFVDYAGDFTVGTKVLHCVTIKSKTSNSPIKYLTSDGANLTQATIATQLTAPIPNTKIWCAVEH